MAAQNTKYRDGYISCLKQESTQDMVLAERPTPELKMSIKRIKNTSDCSEPLKKKKKKKEKRSHRHKKRHEHKAVRVKLASYSSGYSGSDNDLLKEQLMKNLSLRPVEHIVITPTQPFIENPSSLESFDSEDFETQMNTFNSTRYCQIDPQLEEVDHKIDVLELNSESTSDPIDAKYGDMSPRNSESAITIKETSKKKKKKKKKKRSHRHKKRHEHNAVRVKPASLSPEYLRSDDELPKQKLSLERVKNYLTSISAPQLIEIASSVDSFDSDEFEMQMNTFKCASFFQIHTKTEETDCKIAMINFNEEPTIDPRSMVCVEMSPSSSDSSNSENNTYMEPSKVQRKELPRRKLHEVIKAAQACIEVFPNSARISKSPITQCVKKRKNIDKTLKRSCIRNSKQEPIPVSKECVPVFLPTASTSKFKNDHWKIRKIQTRQENALSLDTNQFSDSDRESHLNDILCYVTGDSGIKRIDFENSMKRIIFKRLETLHQLRQ